MALLSVIAPSIVRSATATHVVISEIQIAGGNSNDELVELYNPTDSAINLGGYRLSRVTASGGTLSNLLTTFPDVVIPANGYFLIASSEYDDSTAADATYSTSSHLASNNTVILYSDAGSTIVDKVGLGSATEREGDPVDNPSANGSVERKAWASSSAETMAGGGSDSSAGNGEDTEDNSTDFVQRTTSEPQNSSSTKETPPTPTATPTSVSTDTPTPSVTSTASHTPSNTPTQTATATDTATSTPSQTPSNTATPSATQTQTASNTPTSIPALTVVINEVA